MPETGDAERLVVLLEARVNQFEKNMKKAEGTATGSYAAMRRGSRSATAQMEADMVRSTGRINQALAASSTKIGAFGKAFSAGLVGPLAGLLSATAAINGTKAALEKFGAIADQAAAAGIDPEFFQGIAYQAKLSGIEITSMAGAMASFNKLSGQAMEDRGKLYSGLKEEHAVLLQQIQAAETQEQRFRLVVEAIKDAKTQSEAAVIAAAAFGDQGVQIAAAFRGGTLELDRTIAKARELGIIVDREVIANADALGDEFDTVTEVIDLKLKTALVNLGPVLVYLAGLVADIASDIQILQNPDEWIPFLAGTTAAESRMRKLIDDLRVEQSASTMDDALGITNGAGGIHEAFMGAGSTGTNDIGRGAIARDLERIFGVRMSATSPGGGTSAPDDDPLAGMLGRGGPGRNKLAEPFYDPNNLAKVTEGIGKTISAVDQLRASTDLGQLAFMGLGKSAEAAADLSAESVLGSVGQITGILAGAFQDNKALQAANVVVDTAAGVMKAWSQGGMFAAPMALAIGAAGAAQLGAIMSAKPGSASIATPGTTPSAAPQQPSRSVSLNLYGDTAPMGSVRGLVERLKEELAVDGLELMITHRQS